MEVKGKFDVKRFYEVMEAILSNKYEAKITANIQEMTETVTQQADPDQKVAQTVA